MIHKINAHVRPLFNLIIQDFKKKRKLEKFILPKLKQAMTDKYFNWKASESSCCIPSFSANYF